MYYSVAQPSNLLFPHRLLYWRRRLLPHIGLVSQSLSQPPLPFHQHASLCLFLVLGGPDVSHRLVDLALNAFVKAVGGIADGGLRALDGLLLGGADFFLVLLYFEKLGVHAEDLLAGKVG